MLYRKFFVIMVRFWDENACHAITQFLAMPIRIIEPLLKLCLMLYQKNWILGYYHFKYSAKR